MSSIPIGFGETCGENVTVFVLFDVSENPVCGWLGTESTVCGRLDTRLYLDSEAGGVGFCANPLNSVMVVTVGDTGRGQPEYENSTDRWLSPRFGRWVKGDKTADLLVFDCRGSLASEHLLPPWGLLKYKDLVKCIVVLTLQKCIHARWWSRLCYHGNGQLLGIKT